MDELERKTFRQDKRPAERSQLIFVLARYLQNVGQNLKTHSYNVGKEGCFSEHLFFFSSYLCERFFFQG